MALDTEIPTIDEFLTRFPEFDDGTQDEKIEAIIPEAAAEVGDDWTVEDQKPAIMYLTAHLTYSESSEVVTSGQVQSESFGPMSTTYRETAGGMGAYGSTQYGRRYEQIKARNSSGSVVVVGGVGD